MLFVVKLFPEITIKSRPVRRRLIRILRRNLRKLLVEIDPGVEVSGEWDCIDIETTRNDELGLGKITECLRHTPGIAQFQCVDRHSLTDIDAIASECLQIYQAPLAGKTFAVRCKRQGRHTFTSVDVERQVGGFLLNHSAARGVDLSNPEITVRIEVRHDSVYLIRYQIKGLGGFPLGSQDAALSLISGGFDSAVSSYLCIRRGLLTHYCFFNLGGRAHELAVKEVALYLWLKFSRSHRVKFVTVPFENIVEQILTNVDDSQMGVVLKRMMLRAADQVADKLRLQALVTGESVAQVSSQTLANLAVIDRVTDKLLLRPLITADKQGIIDIAREIGTEQFSKDVPEYCGVISVKPTTRARLERIEREESRLDLSIIERAVEASQVQVIDSVAKDLAADAPDLRISDEPNSTDVVIDIRHPDELELYPLILGNRPEILKFEVPFYRLQTFFQEQDKSKDYLLYCDKGMMSRLHAAHLSEQGFRVGVYQPT